jgi:mono/diheme cytochrome c family protein
MSTQRLAAALAGLMLMTDGGSAVVAADSDNGQRLAERWCGSCHTLSSTHKPSTTTEAPPFSAIANKPNFDASAVALFLLHPHPKMPDMGLSRDSAADLAAFIARQR